MQEQRQRGTLRYLFYPILATINGLNGLKLWLVGIVAGVARYGGMALHGMVMPVPNRIMFTCRQATAATSAATQQHSTAQLGRE